MKLYEDLDEQERRLSNLTPNLKVEDRVFGELLAELFAELYHVPGDNLCPRRVRLVGPVGERPVHVCLLRAGALGKDSEIRAGLIEGVK